MEKIKLALVDDCENWLTAMKDFLNNELDLQIVGTARTREETIRLVQNEDLDVIIMDINLTENNIDGIYITLEVKEISKAKIIMLTCLNEKILIKNSFIAGAVNFLNKENYTQLPNLIRSTYYNNSPIEYILKEYVTLKQEEQIKHLSNAETEVFELLKKGYNKPQIQKILFKSEGTIKNHVNAILKKLGVKNSNEAVKKYKTRGLFFSKSRRP